MKKSLLALAVLGAFATGAQAQSNVTIGGLVQANVKSYKISDTTRVAKNELRVDDDFNSRFWLTGSEDLGGGLSAVFYVENRFNTDQRQSTGLATGAGLADGDTWVGLKGGFGQVTIGKHSWMAVQGLTTEILAAKGVTAMPTSMFGTFTILNQTGQGQAGYLDTTRRVNSIMYRSPNFNGFSGSFGISTASAGAEGTINGTANYNDGKEIYAQLGYANGPLSVSLAVRDQKPEGQTAATINDRQYRLSGFYKLPMGLKVGLQLDRATRDPLAAGAAGNSYSRTAWQIPVSYVFGNNAILASYTRAGDLGGVANTGANMYVLGWDYAMSARTNVGIFYSRLANDTAASYQPFLSSGVVPFSFTGSAPLAGENVSTFAFGVKHTF